MRKLKFIIIVLFFSVFLQGYKFEDTVEHLDAANNAVSHNTTALSYVEMGYYDAAISEYKIAISLVADSPAKAAYYNNLGTLYLKINQLRAAYLCFENAIRLNPIFMEYYKNMVIVFDKSDTMPAWIKYYNNQIQLDKNNSEPYLMLGLIYAQKKQNAKAIAYLQKFIAIEKYNHLSRAAKQMISELRSSH